MISEGDLAGSPDRQSPTWAELEEDIFSEDFLLTRPLLEAIRPTEPVVLLIDEVDRVELETEALLLEILSEYQVSIPELGTVRATQLPMVFLTSNNTRELSEALKRRCLYLHIDYPDIEREREIVATGCRASPRSWPTRWPAIVRSLRTLDLRKPPSVSETLDWARTLVVLGHRVDRRRRRPRDTLHILLKYQSDIERGGQGAAVRPRAERGVPRARPPLGVRRRAARRPGCPVSLTEHLDAAEAVHHMPLEDREALKYALAATLVKSSAPLAGLRDRLRHLLRPGPRRPATTAGRPTRRWRRLGTARRAGGPPGQRGQGGGGGRSR